MLLKMVPEAVTAAWPEIKMHVQRALPEKEQDEKVMSKLLEMLLMERAQCWVSYDTQNDRKANFIGVTIPLYDETTGSKNLLLYNVTNSDQLDLKTSNRMWLEGLEALTKYMKANGFVKLVSYFNDENNRSLRLSKRLGATVKYYVELEV